ncbi:MAG: hypothetical protein ACR5KV_04170 [Wolbachia sp.]
MHGSNDKNRKVPDSERTWIHKNDLNLKRIDNFSDMIRRKEEQKKSNLVVRAVARVISNSNFC